MKPLVAAAVILVALGVGAQAQTPEIDAVRARAEQGDADAQNNLGLMYATGVGVPQDDAEAVLTCPLLPFHWLRESETHM